MLYIIFSSMNVGLIILIGYNIFINNFYKLNLEERKQFLENIFEINDISFYQIFIRDSIVYFRIYVEDIFYQIEFLLEQSIFSSYVKVNCTKRLVLVYVYVSNYLNYSYGDVNLKLLSEAFVNADKVVIEKLFSSFL